MTKNAFVDCWPIFFSIWISIHWLWYLSLGVIANSLWAVYKPYMWIFFPRRLVEVFIKGDGFVISLATTNWLTGYNEFNEIFYCWLFLDFFIWWWYTVVEIRFFLRVTKAHYINLSKYFGSQHVGYTFIEHKPIYYHCTKQTILVDCYKVLVLVYSYCNKIWTKLAIRLLGLIPIHFLGTIFIWFQIIWNS